MTASWPLFRAFGVDVRVNWLVLFFPAVVALFLAKLLGHETETGWVSEFTAAAVWAVPFTVAFYLTVWTHELAHVLTARRFGVPARTITLSPLGCLAHHESPMPSPRAEILTALAGPTSQALWVLALWVPYHVWDIGAAGATWHDWHRVYEIFLVWQVACVVFNLYPCWPMDNGRALRGFLARWLSSKKAALATAQLGYALAIVLFLVGLGMAFYGLAHAPALVWLEILGVLTALIGVHSFLRCRTLQMESQHVESPYEPVESWKSGHAGEAWKDSIAESERLSRQEERRERRETEARRREEDERRKLKDRIDQLLDRINEVGGVEKLPPAERRELAEASERLRAEATAR